MQLVNSATLNAHQELAAKPRKLMVFAVAEAMNVKTVTIATGHVEIAPQIATATLASIVDTAIQLSLKFNCVLLSCPLATPVTAMKCARVRFALVGTAVNVLKMTYALLINSVNRTALRRITVLHRKLSARNVAMMRSVYPVTAAIGNVCSV